MENTSCVGILVGLDTHYFDILSYDVKSFSVSVIVKLKATVTVIRVITVYGSSYEDKKEDFISDLHELFIDYPGHTIIGGDFNLVRFQRDKSNGVSDTNGVTSLMTGLRFGAC